MIMQKTVMVVSEINRYALHAVAGLFRLFWERCMFERICDIYYDIYFATGRVIASHKILSDPYARSPLYM